MKKLIILMIFVLIPVVCMAAVKKDSGSKELNQYLEGISYDVHEGRLSKANFKSHIQESFGVSDKEYKFMSRKKLEPGEMYLVGLIHKATNAKVIRVVNRYRHGKRSWNDVVYYFGATPDELNTMCRADNKKWKKEHHKASKESKKPKATIASAKRVTMNQQGEEWECQCRKKR